MTALASSLFWSGFGDKTPERREPPTPAELLRKERQRLGLGLYLYLEFEDYLEAYAGVLARPALETDR